jgi:hypothetical protein
MPSTLWSEGQPVGLEARPVDDALGRGEVALARPHDGAGGRLAGFARLAGLRVEAVADIVGGLDDDHALAGADRVGLLAEQGGPRGAAGLEVEGLDLAERVDGDEATVGDAPQGIPVLGVLAEQATSPQLGAAGAVEGGDPRADVVLADPADDVGGAVAVDVGEHRPVIEAVGDGGARCGRWRSRW